MIETRNGSDIERAIGGGEKAHRRADHLVAGFYSGGEERQVQGGGAGGGGGTNVGGAGGNGGKGRVRVDTYG